jgi:protein TonB
MNPEQTSAGGPKGTQTERGVVSTGWLAANSTFDRQAERRLGGAVGTSVAVHGVLIALAVFLTMKPEVVTKPIEHMRVVLLQQPPGPGGGGGGSPAPAPPKPIEIPKPKPVPTPVVTPPPTPVDVPIPVVAPVMTTAANLVQASGNVSLAPPGPGGGGRGTGIGTGDGRGVGPGTEAGFGGGAYRGGGIVALKQVDPTYTSEAMRAKVQGSVHLEVIIKPDGTVGEVRIIKSLDRNHGLDQQAIAAAKMWLFRPPTDAQGKSVSAVVTLILDFRLY